MVIIRDPSLRKSDDKSCYDLSLLVLIILSDLDQGALFNWSVDLSKRNGPCSRKHKFVLVSFSS